jgi:hypothetical protein
MSCRGRRWRLRCSAAWSSCGSRYARVLCMPFANNLSDSCVCVCVCVFVCEVQIIRAWLSDVSTSYHVNTTHVIVKNVRAMLCKRSFVRLLAEPQRMILGAATCAPECSTCRFDPRTHVCRYARAYCCGKMCAIFVYRQCMLCWSCLRQPVFSSSTQVHQICIYICVYIFIYI